MVIQDSSRMSINLTSQTAWWTYMANGIRIPFPSVWYFSKGKIEREVVCKISNIEIKAFKMSPRKYRNVKMVFGCFFGEETAVVLFS